MGDWTSHSKECEPSGTIRGYALGWVNLMDQCFMNPTDLCRIGGMWGQTSLQMIDVRGNPVL